MTDSFREHRAGSPSSRRSRFCLSIVALSAALFGSSVVRAEPLWWSGNQEGAALGGYEANGTRLRICRSTDGAYPGNHPGKTQPGWRYCAISFGNREINTTWFETLLPSWESATPYGGTTFGWEGSSTLGVCRGFLKGIPGLRIGKHLRNVNGCSIGYANKEHWTSDYVDLTESSFALVAINGLSVISIEGGWDANLVPVQVCIGTAPGVPGEHPGELHGNACHFGYGGQEKITTTYKTLVPVYRSTNQDLSFPVLVAGKDTNGTQLGVCRKLIANAGGQTGKYRFQDNTCHISYGGQVLVYSAAQGFETLRRR